MFTVKGQTLKALFIARVQAPSLLKKNRFFFRRAYEVYLIYTAHDFVGDKENTFFPRFAAEAIYYQRGGGGGGGNTAYSGLLVSLRPWPSFLLFKAKIAVAEILTQSN